MNDQHTAPGPRSPWRPAETELRPRQTGPSAGTAFATEWALERTAGTAGSSPDAPVFVVVGFDGSVPAQRALDAAAGLLRGREGRLEVVYVAHAPATARLSADAAVEVSNRFDDMERRLAHEVRARLDPTEPRWHFQRRDGAVADELIAVADELRRQRGPDAIVVLVVGGSSHKRHHVLGSVSVNLERVDRFPLLVVP
jgi:nucleotide-binding universal stress UspA family protein